MKAAAFDEAYNVVRDKNHLTKKTTSTFDQQRGPSGQLIDDEDNLDTRFRQRTTFTL